MPSNKQNQRNFKARKKAEGKSRVEFWLTPKGRVMVEKVVKNIDDN